MFIYEILLREMVDVVRSRLDYLLAKKLRVIEYISLTNFIGWVKGRCTIRTWRECSSRMGLSGRRCILDAMRC